MSFQQALPVQWSGPQSVDVVASSDLLALIPHEVYELFRPIAAIKTVALPMRAPSVEVHQYWHPRMAGDPANRFFREFVYRVARE